LDNGGLIPFSAEGLQATRAFVAPLIAGECLISGEDILTHVDAMVQILDLYGASYDLQMAAYLCYAAGNFTRPRELFCKRFGEPLANLAVDTFELMRVQRQASRGASHLQNGDEVAGPEQTENVRKMLLAFSRDLRVVLLRLSSRLQSLRYYAHSKKQPPLFWSQESLQVFAPLANRLGLWQLKWELEDLSFRFIEPETYQSVARSLEQKRSEREAFIQQLTKRVKSRLESQGFKADVQGRAKHIYSIVRKMRGKSLKFDEVLDVSALRVIVPAVDDCYAVLSVLHNDFEPIVEEFDDYIVKPKSNGYQSLHTVVREKTTHGAAAGKPIEIQIRTQAMHDHAESGVAAHWAYKEAGVKGYAGVSAGASYDAKIAAVRQLLAWSKDLSQVEDGVQHHPVADVFSDRIYVLSPQARIVDLPQGATPVDFAYALHTDVGHRCRGARVDGAMVSLNTPLQNGQTVEVVTAKEGGPSRDWLNPELGFLVTHRAKAKVRAWFNVQQAELTAEKGREFVERVLQREGKTAVALDELAQKVGFEKADAMFFAAGKDELSARTLEQALRPPTTAEPEAAPPLRKSRARADSQTGVLVAGVGAMLTQLAKCCKPAPPDAIVGYVTKGRGIAVHRAQCHSLKEMELRDSDRLMPVEWATGGAAYRLYSVDISVQAIDRQGLLRDVSETLVKEKMNVIGVQTHSVKGGGAQADIAWMTFTVEMLDVGRLPHVLAVLRNVKGVRHAQRK
jgi:GTP pyrophosphokinase